MAIAERPAAWLAQRRAGAAPTTDEPPRLAVIAALARAEGPRMLKHPSYVLILPLGFLLVGSRSLADVSLDQLLGALLVFSAVGLFVGTLITANLAAVRSRRDGTGELFGSLPSPAAARTGAQMVALVLGPAAVAFVLSVVTLIYRLAAPDARLMEDIDPVMLPQFPLAVIAIGILAIAVGRWVQSVFGTVFLLAGHIFTGVIWAVPWVILSPEPSVHAWHLLYLVAFIVGFGALAILRDRRRPTELATTVIGIGIAVVAAIAQVPPGGY
jgi:hypothetical protein